MLGSVLPKRLPSDLMAPESSTLKKGTQVVLIAELPGVVAGTTGRVGRAVGINSTRYRVMFDNGVETLSVASEKLVSPATWAGMEDTALLIDDGQDIDAAPPAAVSLASPVTVASPSEPVEVVVPGDAAEKASPAETPPPPPSARTETPEVDDRLAALTAKSREARKEAGVDLDAEVAAEEATETSSAPESTSDATPDDKVEAQEPNSPQLVELPEGYYPPNNRIADLLSSIKDE
mgnify:FL=1